MLTPTPKNQIQKTTTNKLIKTFPSRYEIYCILLSSNFAAITDMIRVAQKNFCSLSISCHQLHRNIEILRKTECWNTARFNLIFRNIAFIWKMILRNFVICLIAFEVQSIHYYIWWYRHFSAGYTYDKANSLTKLVYSDEWYLIFGDSRITIGLEKSFPVNILNPMAKVFIFLLKKFNVS